MKIIQTPVVRKVPPRAHETATGIVIGLHYSAKRQEWQSKDAERIQRALIEPPPPVWELLLDAIDRAAPAVLVMLAVAGIVVGLIGRLS